MNDDEKWKRDRRREDAEFFDELLEGKQLVEGMECNEFFVGLPEDYDECNVVLLIGFKTRRLLTNSAASYGVSAAWSSEGR